MSHRDWYIGLALLTGIFVGCSSAANPAAVQQAAPQSNSPKSGGVLTLPGTGDPPTLDLHAASTSEVSLALQPAYNPLVRYDPLDPTMAKLEPNLAERWEVSPDGKTYTFYLRKGVQFHNGDNLTATDVKYTYERQKTPVAGQVFPRKDSFEPITEITAVDDYTLKLQTSRPYASLLSNLALGWMAVYDKKWVEGGHDPAKEVNGTGPFKFKEWVRGTSFELTKNPNYWKSGFPYLDGVKLFVIPDANTTFAACRTGQVLICDSVTKDQQAQLTKELGDKIRFEKSLGSSGGEWINMQTQKKPFDDVRVRYALSYAIDRDANIQVLYEGDGYYQGYMAAKGQWSLSQEEMAKFPGYGPDKQKNLAEAKRLLADAGYPNGFDITMGVRMRANFEAPSIFLKDQWAKIGVRGTLQIIETNAAYDLLGKGDFQEFEWTTGVGFEDPDSVLGEHYLCNALRNYQHFCDPDFDKMYQQQSQTVDPAARQKIVFDMQRRLFGTMPKIIMAAGSNKSVVIWSTVKDYKLALSSYSNRHYEQVWLDR